MRRLVACAAGAFLALSIPIGSASAALPADAPVGSNLIQADWNGRPDWRQGDWNHRDWHHHWRHEWRDHWYPGWHRHWHRGWDRPYGY